MENGPIEFVTPTSRAIGRMTSILFRPFDLGKWFVLGFTAWLASLMEGNNSFSSNSRVGANDGTAERDWFESSIRPAMDFARENLNWIIPVAIIVVILLIALFVVLLWVGSRGKLMFLDNVVYNRALVKQPWREFRALGNSLFRWRLGFSLVAMAILLGIIGIAAFFLITTFESRNVEAGWFIGLAVSVVVVTAVAFVVGYIAMLLENFVIPLMWKYSFTTSESWRRVLSLHRARPGYFILFALWNLLLLLGAFIVILVAILITCCIGLLLLAIPYLGAVLMLPISVFFRALGPEFLRQFGSEYDLWSGGGDPFGFEAGSMPYRDGY